MAKLAQKILIVEDDEILSKVLTEELHETGFDVHQAANGEEGLRAIREFHPDLVLLDILMPKMDGFALLQVVKNAAELKQIPVIMLTMLGSDEDIKKGLKMGAADYIVKSQHAVAEIVEKVKGFFSEESHPTGTLPR